MAETKRRPPAIFDRALGEYQPTPSVGRVVPFQEPPLPASPVIAFRYGQWLGDAVKPLVGTGPRHLPFPYFEQPPPPASSVITFRYGQDVLGQAKASVKPRFLPFPYWQEPPPAAANPVIPIRLGQGVLVRSELEAFVPPQVLPFPYFEQPTPANPIIGTRYGQPSQIILEEQGALGIAHYLSFPYFQAGIPGPAIGVVLRSLDARKICSSNLRRGRSR